jgi:hypothetical protein
MTKTILGGALALPLLLSAHAAIAQETNQNSEITALGYRPDAHGPAGMMGDHTHSSSELMIGLMWMHMRHSGTNVSRKEEISNADIAAAGYTARTQDMTMDMAMLHIMYAPNDRFTFTLMPTWSRMEMTMLGIGEMPMDGGMDMDEHAGHTMLLPGETMTHSVSGMGDTKLGALVSLSRNPALSAHVGLTLSVPTGSVSKKDHDGNFVHYGMQPGSGTWDLEPSFTLHGIEPGFSWGLQTSYLWRTEGENESGFAFGDRFSASAWLSKPLGRGLSLSARLAYTDEGQIEGHYNAGHNHASPPDRQANYGGQVIEAGIGTNVVIGDGLRLGAEATVPLYQDLNGIQSPRDYGISVNVSRMF